MKKDLRRRTFELAAKTSGILGYCWLVICLVIFALSSLGFFIAAPSLYEGWKEWAAVMSPFNIANYIVSIALLSPAALAFTLKGFFERKVSNGTIIHE